MHPCRIIFLPFFFAWPATLVLPPYVVAKQRKIYQLLRPYKHRPSQGATISNTVIFFP
jgi:hypothetical protein